MFLTIICQIKYQIPSLVESVVVEGKKTKLDRCCCCKLFDDSSSDLSRFLVFL
jgi:hypothetical protein